MSIYCEEDYSGKFMLIGALVYIQLFSACIRQLINNFVSYFEFNIKASE